jgi:hypothetical protein
MSMLSTDKRLVESTLLNRKLENDQVLNVEKFLFFPQILQFLHQVSIAIPTQQKVTINQIVSMRKIKLHIAAVYNDNRVKEVI